MKNEHVFKNCNGREVRLIFEDKRPMVLFFGKEELIIDTNLARSLFTTLMAFLSND